MRNNEDRLSGLITKQENVAAISQNNSLSFVVPTEYVDLPSMGKLYPVGHPLREKTSIEIKQMTAKEEDILTSETYIKKGVALEKFLESIIVDKTIRSEDLCATDRAAIFLAARILAYGPEYKVSLVCPKCSKQHTLSYDLINEPTVEKLDETFQVNERGTFFFDLPTTKWKVECRAMLGKDENKIEKEKTNDSNISSYLSSLVVSINDATDKKLLEEAISVMPAKDSRFLRAKYKELIPSVKFTFKLDCDCGNNSEVDVPITLEFFWPK